MKWYTAYYGSWKEPEGVRKIIGTGDRKKCFEEAQKVANEKNTTVTISSERGSARGLYHHFYEVKPEY